jgi:hypothetical protein
VLLFEREIDISANKGVESLLSYFAKVIREHISPDEIPIRFVITASNEKKLHCELGILKGIEKYSYIQPCSVFDFISRRCENTSQFNVVMIVPTGIAANIGGHAGDASAAARLIASACDNLITHPNVVNASDINELPENGLYVEGSVLSRLLMGTISLQRVRSNRIMLIYDKHHDRRISEFVVNSVSAARATLGLDCPLVVELDDPMRMYACYSSSGRATGRVESFEKLYEILYRYKLEYDAVAISSIVNIPKGCRTYYYSQLKEDIANPWGGIEAMLTHTVTSLFGIPAAHSPMLESMDIVNKYVGTVDPRMSAEVVSTSFLYCILKGLHRSPRIITDRMLFANPGILTAADISCLVIPDGCIGLPTLAALEQGIPVIAVKENRNRMENDLEKLPFAKGKLFIVENYLEAVGVMTALKAGIAVPSVRRPLVATKVMCEHIEDRSEGRKAAPKLSEAATVDK